MLQWLRVWNQLKCLEATPRPSLPLSLRKIPLGSLLKPPRLSPLVPIHLLVLRQQSPRRNRNLSKMMHIICFVNPYNVPLGWRLSAGSSCSFIKCLRHKVWCISIIYYNAWLLSRQLFSLLSIFMFISTFHIVTCRIGCVLSWYLFDCCIVWLRSVRKDIFRSVDGPQRRRRCSYVTLNYLMDYFDTDVMSGYIPLIYACLYLFLYT